MNYTAYHDLFDEILTESNPVAPYDNEEFQDVVKMNQIRMKRWDANLTLSNELIGKLRELDAKQHWIIITEPWCLEAAHMVPFLVKMAEAGEFISYELQLRDSEPLLISSYLTNGAKAIPIMIVRDEYGNDLFVWGPRPEAAQIFRDSLSAANKDLKDIKKALLLWYNADKGRSLNAEILRHYEHVKASAPVLSH
ncbi:MAG: thioredoxin family protein [Chitinophagaceae bacterium]